ncbi:protein chromatin remodeling 8 [Tanacetum coccineum]
MTGAPIQNRLSELWSLFDFVFPGKLGVQSVFEAEFDVPISVGGYANASPMQVSNAYRFMFLRDLIMPYLLRRMKAVVNAQLPTKTDHVLFCSLTDDHRAFLASSDVEQIFNGERNSLYGIDVMLVAQVLKVWKEQGHRVLLFAQTQQMLDIIENFMIDTYTYRRMDGLTPVKQRMTLMDEFNNSPDIFIFILTTKVGGLGTNHTGANRVIIFDPDWNPSTDMQVCLCLLIFYIKLQNGQVGQGTSTKAFCRGVETWKQNNNEKVQTAKTKKNPGKRFVTCSKCRVYDFLDDDLPSEYYKELLYGMFQKQKQSKKHMDYEQVINVLAREKLMCEEELRATKS